MADLKTKYMGVDLDNPIVVSSSGITGSLQGVERCVEAGAGAVVLKSMFEELITADSVGLEQELAVSEHPEIFDYVRAGIGMRLGPLPYLEFIEEVRKRVSVPVIASVNCTSPDWWVPFSERIEAAGAHALELNISHFPQETGEDPRAIEKRYVEIVRKVTERISIPVAVKLGFYFTSLWNLLEELVDAGAKGLVLFNRYYSIDVDLDGRTIVPAVSLSSPEDVHLPLRWVGLAAGRLECDLAASTGVHDSQSIVKLLLVGATVVQVCSALYRRGPGYLTDLRKGLTSWLDQEGFHRVADIRGLALERTADRRTLLTRFQYVKALEEASAFYQYE